MLGLFPNSPSLTQLNPVATAVCIRTLSLWTLSLSRIKMTIRTPQATRGEGNAATLPYFIRSFKPCCTPIALLSGWGYVRVPAYADYLWGGSLTYYNYYIKSWHVCQVFFNISFQKYWHQRPSTSSHLWSLYVSPCVFLWWTQCYCPHSSLVDTSFGCNQRLSLYVSSSIHVVRFWRSGKESNLTQPMDTTQYPF